MSKIWLLCSIVLWFGCKPKDLPTVADLNGDRITVKFSHQSTKAEMEQIARDLQEKYTINMDFSKSIFFDDGKLRELDLNIFIVGGSGGHTRALLTNLQYKYYGFSLELKKTGKAPFKIGAIE